MRRRGLRGTLAALLLCAGQAALAHSFHLGMTDIAVNPRSGNTEIVHTFMLHDIEARLAELHQRPLDLAQPADEALLRAYIERQFSIAPARRGRLPLRWVGISANTESLTIYQEIAGAPIAADTAITNAVLLDYLPDQSNTLNLKLKGPLKSLLFDRRLSRQLVR